MPWEQITKADSYEWNERLKQTSASFYQFPYFITTEYDSFFSQSVFFKYIDNKEIIAYAAIVEIGLFSFKIGIIEDGPVFLKEYQNKKTVIADLKKVALKRKYIHLQIRANDKDFENELSKDKNFENKVVFPFHKKEEYDWNIYNQPEDQLLAGFKIQCRRKIVLAGRIDFRFTKLEDNSQLFKIHDILCTAAKEKKYKQRPFRVFREMYLEGKKHGLADIFVAYLNDQIVNVVFIVKDAKSFYHLSSAVVLEGYHVNESPPAKLHFFLMKECFYTEHKEFYNISYGGSENLIRFKELFNPVELEKRPYYTYVIRPRKLAFLEKLNPQHLPGLRNFLRRIGDLFHTNTKLSLLFIFVGKLILFCDLSCMTNA